MMLKSQPGGLPVINERSMANAQYMQNLANAQRRESLERQASGVETPGPTTSHAVIILSLIPVALIVGYLWWKVL